VRYRGKEGWYKCTLLQVKKIDPNRCSRRSAKKNVSKIRPSYAIKSKKENKKFFFKKQGGGKGGGNTLVQKKKGEGGCIV